MSRIFFVTPSRNFFEECECVRAYGTWRASVFWISTPEDSRIFSQKKVSEFFSLSCVFWAKNVEVQYFQLLNGTSSTQYGRPVPFEASGAKPIRTRTCKMISFFPSVTSFCGSSRLNVFYRHLLVGFIQFLDKYYDGFTIYHIPKFWLPRIFSISD